MDSKLYDERKNLNWTWSGVFYLSSNELDKYIKTSAQYGWQSMKIVLQETNYSNCLFKFWFKE